MSRRGVIALGVLLLWVILGPIGMVFTTCAVMAMMCDSSCGLASSATFAPTLSSTPGRASGLIPTIANHLPLNAFTGLEPPPKPFAPSA